MSLKNIPANVAMALDDAYRHDGRKIVGDSAPSVFFDRQLEQIKQRLVNVLYPDLFARQFIPPSPEPVPANAETFTIRTWDMRGAWRVATANSSEIKRADVFATEQTFKVYPIEGAFGYNLDDLERSQFTGTDISAKRAVAAMKAIQEGIDEILAFGLVNYGFAAVTGFLNNANVTTSTVATVSGATTWDAKMPVEPKNVLADIATVYNSIQTTSKEVFKPDTLLLPPSSLRLLEQQNRSSATDRTVLEEVRQKFPLLKKIGEWQRLETAGAGGVKRAVMYKASDDCLYYEIPREAYMLPVFQESPTEWFTKLRAKVAGVIIERPLSLQYFDGI